ncbi:MAG: hypothetical protein QXP02_01715 [Desulfurococcaceae archaeon]
MDLIRSNGFTPVIKYVRERSLRDSFVDSIVIKESGKDLWIMLRIFDNYVRLRAIIVDRIDEEILDEIEETTSCQIDIDDDHVYISCNAMLEQVIEYLKKVLEIIEGIRNER